MKVRTGRLKAKMIWPVLCVLVLLVMLLSLAYGAVALRFVDVISSLLGHGDARASVIVLELRLPRTILAFFVGVLLAASGAVAQGLFRNPLADPSLIGVAAGASAGASLVIVFLLESSPSILGLSLVSVGAFLGALLTVLLIYRISSGPLGISVSAMLLTGIAVSYLAGSLSGFLEFIADNEMLRQISLWRMGGLDSADFTHVGIAAAVSVVMFLCLPRYFPALNALLLGESEARHLGINIQHLKLSMTFWLAMGVGISVALAGMVAFIGLIVPHAMRMLVGPRHELLVPMSAIAGGVLLIVADTLARTLLAPTELPVGLITAVLGAPVFISLLIRRHQYGMQ